MLVLVLGLVLGYVHLVGAAIPQGAFVDAKGQVGRSIDCEVTRILCLCACVCEGVCECVFM